MATEAAIVERNRCAVLAGSRLRGKGLARGLDSATLNGGGECGYPTPNDES
jgi:hypothetical protein